MTILEILLISISLAIDAFSVSICKGLSMKKMDYKKAIIIALYFGIFQMIMPIIGYLLGNTFESIITSIDHYIIFALLGFIGINMIKDSYTKENKIIEDTIAFKNMIVYSLATSIDALAVGITFSFLKTNIMLSSTIIGITAFIFSFIGVKIGNRFGNKHEKKSQLLGGIILILLGIKILIEHLL